MSPDRIPWSTSLFCGRGGKEGSEIELLAMWETHWWTLATLTGGLHGWFPLVTVAGMTILTICKGDDLVKELLISDTSCWWLCVGNILLTVGAPFDGAPPTGPLTP